VKRSGVDRVSVAGPVFEGGSVMPIEGCAPYASQDVEKYSRMRWWLGMTWGDVFDKHTDIYPGRTGLVDDRGRWTNRELRQQVDKLAIGLMKLGIRPKERVLLQLPNWHEFVFSFLALQKIGAIVVVLIPRHNPLEINHFCRLTDPVAWILPRQYGKIEYQPVIDDVLSANRAIRADRSDRLVVEIAEPQATVMPSRPLTKIQVPGQNLRCKITHGRSPDAGTLPAE